MVQKSLHFKTFIGESRIFFFIIISREMIGDITFFSELAALKGSGGILFANYFFFMLNKKKRNDLFMSVLLDDVRSFFFSNIVNTMMSRSKLEQSKWFFFCGNSLFTARSHSHGN